MQPDDTEGQARTFSKAFVSFGDQPQTEDHYSENQSINYSVSSFCLCLVKTTNENRTINVLKFYHLAASLAKPHISLYLLIVVTKKNQSR